MVRSQQDMEVMLGMLTLSYNGHVLTDTTNIGS